MKVEITNGGIPSAEQMKQEISKSHKRSASYGISFEERNVAQKKLSPLELEDRRRHSGHLLEVVIAHIEEFYELLSPEDFMVAFADEDGFILHLAGSDEIKLKFSERNCAPGYRWTESDVGTTAISLCCKLECPVQLNDKDHYCRRAHGFTSSAAPIFGRQGTFSGVLVVSGASSEIHPHTLIMVTMAARSIEKHMRLLRRNNEMSLYIGFLDRVLEAAGTGLLTMDNDMRIWKINRKGKEILKTENLDGQPISILQGLGLDLDDIAVNPDKWKGREASLLNDAHFYYTAQPVLSERSELLGAVMVFEEFSNIRKLAERISGAEPFFMFEHLIGSSPAFTESVKLAEKAAKTSSTVLLLGETGTGKELFAQAIHNGSQRCQQPFVPINCGAIPGELLESELFGYVDGAYTGASRGGRPGKFELANEGTILLDEIGDMPHDMQVKLLRVLQTGEIQRIGARKTAHTDTRIIAATHVDLDKMIELNRFRKDLFYRLNIIQITLPPLRQRGAEDIEALAAHFINRYGEEILLSEAALKALVDYDWPGNVRELENVIQRAMHLCGGKTINPEHLGLQARTKARNNFTGGTLRDLEQKVISDTLVQLSGNMAQAAKSLGISRATLYRKVKEYGLAL
ncbi:MAG: sigma-54-dependent Fis family transcriptional regulator [Desulfofustis sp.]|nr:sigma-54-dependent Fis family transcriptional regulator [Desulfofustis sp.]